MASSDLKNKDISILPYSALPNIAKSVVACYFLGYVSYVGFVLFDSGGDQIIPNLLPDSNPMRIDICFTFCYAFAPLARLLLLYPFKSSSYTHKTIFFSALLMTGYLTALLGFTYNSYPALILAATILACSFGFGESLFL